MGNRPADKAIIDWKGYHGNAAIFPVCMRSPSVRGRSLTAQLDAAAKKIDHMVICMCDTLDRHNMVGIDNREDYCVELADAWLEGQYSEFKTRFKSVEVLRWERDIRNHPDFASRLESVKGLGQTSHPYAAMRDAMCRYYLASKRRRFEDDEKRGVASYFDSRAALQSSRDYLEEEFAGDMIYYKLTGGLPNIYWGLYVDDYKIFTRESGSPSLAFPDTLGVTTSRHGPSVKASSLLPNQASYPQLKRA